MNLQIVFFEKRKNNTHKTFHFLKNEKNILKKNRVLKMKDHLEPNIENENMLRLEIYNKWDRSLKNFMELSPCLSPLDFWNIKCHSIFFQFQTQKKNRFQNKLDFLSSFNLIFTACVACKNQFRNQIDFLNFLNLIFRNWKKIVWHLIFQKSSGDRQWVS